MVGHSPAPVATSFVTRLYQGCSLAFICALHYLKHAPQHWTMRALILKLHPEFSFFLEFPSLSSTPSQRWRSAQMLVRPSFQVSINRNPSPGKVFAYLSCCHRGLTCSPTNHFPAIYVTRHPRIGFDNTAAQHQSAILPLHWQIGPLFIRPSPLRCQQLSANNRPGPCPLD